LTSGEFKRGSVIAGLIAILWLAIVFALYYAGHKPFTPANAAAISRTFGYLLVAFALVSVAGGLGKRLLPGVVGSPCEALALQAALGLGLLGAGFLLVGVTSGFSVFVAWVVLVLVAILIFKEMIAWWRTWLGLGQAWGSAGPLGKALAVCTVLILGFTLQVALAPPVKFDTMVYHLALPVTYINSGRFEYVSTNIFWGMPQLAEMLYTWSMLLAGGVRALPAATCLGWAIGLLALVGLLGSATRRYGSAGWVAPASLLAGSTIASSMGWGYVEWFTILFGWAFLTSLDRWRENRMNSQPRIWVFIAGAFAGFAFGSKYSAGALLIAGVVFISWKILQDREWKTGLLDIGSFLFVAMAAVSPWLLKNLLNTGNPFYPFLFPSGAMDAYRLNLYQGISKWGDWREVFLLPLRATFGGFEGAPGYAAAAGPLMLGLAAIYPFGRWLRIGGNTPSAGAAATVALVGLVIWAIAGRLSGLLIQTRLYMAFLPSFAMLAAGGFVTLAGIQIDQIRIGRVAGSLVCLAVAFNTLQIGIESLSYSAGQALVGLRSEQDYLAGNLGWYAHTAEVVNKLPEPARVLMLWEPRGLYCQPRCDPDEILDRWLSDYQAFQSPEAILDNWRQSGYTHLLYHRSGAEFVRQEDTRYTHEQWQMLDRLLASLSSPTNSGDVYSLYTLTP
jgi:hypothetical protein